MRTEENYNVPFQLKKFNPDAETMEHPEFKKRADINSSSITRSIDP